MYPDDFEYAVNHAMLYEVGSGWKLTPEVEAGLINTPAQRRAVGYTNDPLDNGGETKFGIARNADNVDVTNLTWAQAKDIYYKKYWIAGKCDQLPGRVAILHFDGCVNHGIGRANKFLQRALGVADDGIIGPMTIGAANNADPFALCLSICEQRAQFYQAIVDRRPDQIRFLKGWLRRINEMRDFVSDPNRF